MQLFQFYATVVAATLALPSITLAGPIAAAESVASVDLSANDTVIVPREGPHYASFYQQDNCGGNYAGGAQDWGCGGFCFTVNSAHSIWLRQEGLGPPYPTASLYSSSDCSGSHTSAGIEGTHLQGCTNSNGVTWRSAYLYFNC
jgi:hypothetical protein